MRLIDADALLDGFDVRKVTEYDESGCGIDYKAVSVKAIETAPTVEAEPVRHGKWVECISYDPDGYIDTEYKCSLCGRYEVFEEPYCHCGAKMDKAKAGE